MLTGDRAPNARLAFFSCHGPFVKAAAVSCGCCCWLAAAKLLMTQLWRQRFIPRQGLFMSWLAKGRPAAVAFTWPSLHNAVRRRTGRSIRRTFWSTIWLWVYIRRRVEFDVLQMWFVTGCNYHFSEIEYLVFLEVSIVDWFRISSHYCPQGTH